MNKLLFLLSFLLLSCSNNNRVIREDLSSLTFQHTVIPEDIQMTINGKDTTINDFFSSNLKMVVYTNSESCSSCALNKLHMWHDIIQYAEPYKGELKYCFIFNPPKGESIRPALRNSLLDYPVLLDSLGEFERLNPHLPKNKAMHTFLLDEDNNVILVGNPLQNKEIEKMFYEEVEKRLR